MAGFARLQGAELSRILNYLDPESVESAGSSCKFLHRVCIELEETLLQHWSASVERSRLRDQMATHGYVDGLEQGRGERIQEGFNDGFYRASVESFSSAYTRGLIGAAAVFASHKSIVSGPFASALTSENARVNGKILSGVSVLNNDGVASAVASADSDGSVMLHRRPHHHDRQADARRPNSGASDAATGAFSLTDMCGALSLSAEATELVVRGTMPECHRRALDAKNEEEEEETEETGEADDQIRAKRKDLFSRVSVRDATAADVDVVVAVINEAYMVETGTSGLGFKSGVRTNSDEVLKLVDDPVWHVFVFEAPEDEGGGIVAVVCYRVRKTSSRAYFGPFAVSPSFQGRGLGSSIVEWIAERAASDGCSAVDIGCVNHRTDLLPFYKRHGWKITGTRPLKIPTLTRPSHMIEMSRTIVPHDKTK